jgi:hypothetical protein
MGSKIEKTGLNIFNLPFFKKKEQEQGLELKEGSILVAKKKKQKTVQEFFEEIYEANEKKFCKTKDTILGVEKSGIHVVSFLKKNFEPASDGAILDKTVELSRTKK